MDLGLAGRRVLVTGGSYGIGLAIARELVDEGAAVAICARTESRLDAAVAELSERGGPVVRIAADVDLHGKSAAVVEEAASRLGGLDGLVVCVGGHVGARWLPETSREDWLATLTLNVLHPVDASRAAVPYLRERDGSVLFIASITGWRPGPSSAYATAKAAVIHLAATLAQELGPYGIRVNALSPGSTGDTEGWKDFQRSDHEAYDAFIQDELPLRRLVTTREIAAFACLAISPRGSGLTGANLTVDAGQYRPHAIRFPASV
jgi:3-oxoacyl-[acyl-carrier protein] reductase